MKVPFDIAKAIPAAWKLLWADNLRIREDNRDFRGNTYYLTARDVEMQVRQFAQETVAGEPWGTYGRVWGGYPGKAVRIKGDLNNMVRSWLLNNPNVTGHNFGRGHISGMRFRPKGEPLGPSEIKTMKQKAEEKLNPKPRPIHYSVTYGPPLCTKKMPRYGMMRSKARTLSDIEDVTCKRCLKLWAAQHPEQKPQA